MIVLGIETSCDETSAALLKGEKHNLTILSNIVSSQADFHAQWGGVVPNLAAREHVKNVIPVLQATFQKAGVSASDIDLIAVTNGPGLIPALLIGTTTAKTLSYLWQKPLMGIHHIEGHIYANFLKSRNNGFEKEIEFPILGLIISGGHTQLIFMKKHLDYKIIGQTLDDAAGEAFDKTARILGLGYPGGPALAQKARSVSKKDSVKIELPRPMMSSPDFDFSFSGLKTAVLYLTKKNERSLKKEKFVAQVCREFQQAVIDVLISKTLSAAKKFKPKTIILAGGVSANQELRRQLGNKIKSEFPHISYQIPDRRYSLDNAAMIAAAGFYRWKSTKNKLDFRNSWKTLEAEANLKIK